MFQQRLQFAIDYTVHLCIMFLWNSSRAMVNVMNGKSLAHLVGNKKKVREERKARKSEFR